MQKATLLSSKDQVNTLLSMKAAWKAPIQAFVNVVHPVSAHTAVALCLDPRCSTRGDFAPPGQLAVSEDTFICQNWESGGYRGIMTSDRGQGCCETSYNAPDNLPEQTYSAQNANCANDEKP